MKKSKLAIFNLFAFCNTFSIIHSMRIFLFPLLNSIYFQNSLFLLRMKLNINHFNYIEIFTTSCFGDPCVSNVSQMPQEPRKQLYKYKVFISMFFSHKDHLHFFLKVFSTSNTLPTSMLMLSLLLQPKGDTRVELEIYMS